MDCNELKELRRGAGMSGAEMARRMRIDVARLHRIEVGKSAKSADFEQMYLAILECWRRYLEAADNVRERFHRQARES